LNLRPPGHGSETAPSGYDLDAAQKSTDNFLNEILTMLSYNGTINTIRRIRGMKLVPGSKRHHYPAIVGIFLLTAALIAGMPGCEPTPAPNPTQYSLTISSTEGGEVITPGEGTFVYDEGRVVNLVAQPDEDYIFIKWTGDVNTIANVYAATTAVTMNGNYTITAEFTAENGDVLRVGLARDLDGPLGVFDCYGAGPVYRWFHDKVNDEGGLYLSGYNVTVPLELIIRDFDVLTWDLAAATDALITRDKCDFIWGGPGTDCIFTQAPVCNTHGVLLTTLEGGASSMIWDEDIDAWPYVWVSSSFSNWYQIPVLYDILDAQLGHDPIAYITYIGGMGATHGIEYREETINEFGAGNIIDAGFHSYDLSSSPGAADTIIANAKTALGNAADPNYDIFCAFTYPWNVAALTLACIDSEFNPPAILFGPGANYNSYPVDFGPYAEGIMGFIVANNSTSTAISNMYAELATQVEADWDDPNLLCDQGPYVTGWDALDYWGMPCYVAALQLWATAVEDAGNLDSMDVRDSLASLNTTTVLGANTWYTVFGGGFGGGILAYECHTGEIGQWQSGVYEIIGFDGINATLPNYCVTADLIYPMTDLWGWLS